MTNEIGIENDYSVKRFEDQKSQYVTDQITITEVTTAIATFLALGQMLGDALESNVQTKMLKKGKALKLSIQIISNTLDQALAITLRKNGADTTQTVSIPATNSVDVESPNEIDFVAGDLLDIALVAAATTGTIVFKIQLLASIEA